MAHQITRLTRSAVLPSEFILPTIVLTGIMLAWQLMGQSQAQAPPRSAPANTSTLGNTVAAVIGPSTLRQAFPKREQSYYELFWGVDSMRAKALESGELIKFSYRILNADKAKALNDKANEPYLIDPAAGVKLVIPSLEKVGQLRQASTPEAGKIYWMAFSNPGRVVKRGNRVTVVIGPFHIDGLVVE